MLYHGGCSTIESRRLIPFGKFSYVISLPKAWVKKNRLGKGSDIYLKEEQDSLILSLSHEPSKKELKEVIISVDDKTIPTLKTEIISAYINNYNLITVKSDQKDFDAERIKEIFHSLIAMEVVEQDKNKIVAKDFLNYDDASVSNLLRRIDNITRSMITDSLDCIDHDNSETVVHRDFDVNRLFYLSQRVIKTALNDPSLAKSFKLSNSDLTDTWFVIMSLEKIADAAKRIARMLQTPDLSKKERELIRVDYKRIQQNFLDVMKAFHTLNFDSAFEVLNENRKEMHRIKNLSEHSTSTAFVEIVEKIKVVQTYVKRISQIIINKEKGESHGI